MGESPSDPLGGDHSAGSWQRTGAVGEGGPAHPDNTLEECSNRDGGLEFPGCWTAVMRKQGGAISSPTFDLQ